MQRYGTCICTLACFLSLTVPSLGQENPWNGSWNVDRSTLKYDGPTSTVHADASGFTVTRNGKSTPKVVCDDKPNAPYQGIVTTCLKTAGGYHLENTRDGKLRSKTDITFSQDGKTKTRTSQVFPPDAAPFKTTFVSKRIAGSAGTATWKEVSFEESEDTGLLSILVKGDSVDLKETDADQPTTCKLDGTETAIPGSRTMSAKLEDPHTLKVTYSYKGEVQRVNTFVLSADGKTVKETDTTPPPLASTMSVSFNKS